nr:MAG TPA: baseplate assembly protein [Caudoviricetes sp.]
MTPLENLPDITFVDSNKDVVLAELISLYTQITGRSLAQGDPIRLFLNTIAEVIIQQRAWINHTGKQNLLRYATGGNLDHIGVLVGAERLDAAAATTTVKIILSEERAVSTLVLAGTRITAGDNVFFALENNVNILGGETTATGSARCTVTGSVGNGYLPGELKTIVDPVPFVASMVNTTKSEGGADIESDDSYREVIHEAPEKFSCAGPDGAYKYYAKRASALIADVAVTSPTPGKVQIVPLLEGGEIPGNEILNAVLAVCNDRTVRPLTDQVSAVAPTKVEFNITATYYIDRDNEARATTIQQQVTEAVNDYALWQKSKLGRDINPSELIHRIMKAGAKRVVVTAPEYAIVSATQVATAKTINVSLGGLEYE